MKTQDSPGDHVAQLSTKAFQFPQVEEERESGEQEEVQVGSSVSVQPSFSWSKTDQGLLRFS